MVHLQHVYEEYEKRGVVILGFNSADDPEIANKFLRKKKVTFPNILDSSRAAQDLYGRTYRGSGVPLNYIIDREGRVAAAFSGYAEGDLRGIEAIEDALAGVTAGDTDSSGGLVGTVLGPDGQPLARAFVRLSPTTRWYRKGRRLVSTRTDADGRYDLTAVLPGVYELSVQVVGASSYVVSIGRVYVRPGLVEAYPVSVPDSSLSGRVTRAEGGEPLGSREVQINATAVEVKSGKVVRTVGGDATAFADRDGRFSFIGLPPGTYRIRILPLHPSVKRSERIVEFDGNELASVDFSLEARRFGTLRVQVLEPDGRPAEKVRFSIVTGPSSTLSMSGRQIEPGIYEIPLAVGHQEVSARRDRLRSDTMKVTIREGKTVERKLRLRTREDG
jgi:hypothetical protein